MLNQSVIHALQQEDEQSVLIKIIVPMEWISYHSPLFDFSERKISTERVLRPFYSIVIVGWVAEAS